MDPELQYRLDLHDVTDRKSAKATFLWLLKNREFIALEKAETHKVIGHIAIHPPIERCLQDPDLKGKVGASLSFAVSKDERKKGLMSEALAALIDFLFAQRHLDYIDCEHTSFNLASKNIQKKLGFAYRYTQEFDDTTLLINILENPDK